MQQPPGIDPASIESREFRFRNTNRKRVALGDRYTEAAGTREQNPANPACNIKAEGCEVTRDIQMY